MLLYLAISQNLWPLQLQEKLNENWNIKLNRSDESPRWKISYIHFSCNENMGESHNAALLFGAATLRKGRETVDLLPSW